MILTVWVTACFAACSYNTTFNDCKIHCATTGTACPDGLVCGNEGLCRTTTTAATCAAILDAGIDTNNDAPQQFSSCNGLSATCGAANENCCTSLPVPGGTFYRSYDVASDGMYSNMSYPATVSMFTLDKYEVTVGRFRMFVKAGMGTQANPPPTGIGARVLNGAASQGGWDPTWNTGLAADTNALVAAMKCDGAFETWTDAPGANEELPINCVTWYEAFAFCTWDGGFLPTEAEWNYAAAGGAEQRAYPWSNPAGSTTIDCSYANYRGCVNPPNGAANRVGNESPKGDGRWGQTDLAGNAWEWTLDGYQTPYAVPCDACADLTDDAMRVTRGGSFLTDILNLRNSSRFYVPSNNRFDYSVRCARNM